MLSFVYNVGIPKSVPDLFFDIVCMFPWCFLFDTKFFLTNHRMALSNFLNTTWFLVFIVQILLMLTKNHMPRTCITLYFLGKVNQGTSLLIDLKIYSDQCGRMIQTCMLSLLPDVDDVNFIVFYWGNLSIKPPLNDYHHQTDLFSSYRG